ncbi:hypothetical protein TOPH_06051 [Tolypocladium ophioglossoides CBS 100239]|uniref:DUF6594 domain-containing protein n=1 Tax=Tolypocladium ophioglossoides (strain CBS 100239) TaxID=1163406 RepID=A0A0L0N6C0_TOLOC|nr:hypothetical protein TOPH_06051 [Tolypocladium ophioglossoides CBS 100239]
MDGTNDSGPGHGITPADSQTGDSQPSLPEQDTRTTDASTAHSAQALPSRAPPMTEPRAEEGSLDESAQSDTPSATNIQVSPLPGSISPLPLPEEGKINAMAATVEDYPDEDEAHTQTAQTAHTPPSLSSHSCATTLTTPRTPNSARLSVNSVTTVTQTPHVTEARSETSSQRRHAEHQADIYHAPRPRRRPSALDYLVSEAPTGNPKSALETIYKRLEMGAHHAHDSNGATPPSVLGSRRGDAPREVPFDAGPHVNWTPDYSGPGEAFPMPGFQPGHAFPRMHGSPQMGPMSNMAMSHAPPQSVLQLGYGAEKPPMSGYQLVAAKLVGGLGGPPVTPLYRRFEALNHRLLLYMQADLADLENELLNLDMKDTIERGYGLLPASRRQERWGSSSLALQRTEILGQIGYKLCQYNKVITSFRKMQDMPPPSMDEIHRYKVYLASSRLLVDDETRFLDAPEDLFSLAMKEPMPEGFVADEGTTPMPRLAEEVEFPARSRNAPESEADSWASGRRPSVRPSTRTQDTLGATVSQLGLAMFVAVFAPIVTFSVIPTFAGRIAVVLLVGTSVATALMQSGAVRLLDRGMRDWILCAGIYGGAMAAVAGALA